MSNPLSSLLSRTHLYFHSRYEYLHSRYEARRLKRASAASRGKEAAAQGNQSRLDWTLVRDPKEGTWVSILTVRRAVALIALVLIAICVAISVMAYLDGPPCRAEGSARPTSVSWPTSGAARDEGGE